MLTLGLKDCWAGPEPLGSLSSWVGPKRGVCGSCGGGGRGERVPTCVDDVGP